MHTIVLLISCVVFASHARRLFITQVSSRGDRSKSQNMELHSNLHEAARDPKEHLALLLQHSSLEPSAAWQVNGVRRQRGPAARNTFGQVVQTSPAVVMTETGVETDAPTAVVMKNETAELPKGASPSNFIKSGEVLNPPRDFQLLENAEAYHARIDEATKEDIIDVIVFTAKWCRTCKAMVPKLKRLADKFPQNGFFEMDFEKNKDLVNKLGIRSLPYVQVLGGSQGITANFTCARGKIVELLKILEYYTDVAETTDANRPTFPHEWNPYLTNIQEVGSGNFGKVFSMDLTCPDSNVTKVAMKDLARDKMNKRLMENEIEAGQSLKDFLLSDAMDAEEDPSAYCEPLLADPRLVDGHWYLPMPFCNQGEFSGIYQNSTKRTLFGGDKGMYALLLHVAKGVKALHRAGWVHNDLHGRNALVTCTTDTVPGSCYASIIDLGLASRRDQKTSGARGYRFSISPEVVALGMEEDYPNPKSDVWELGMLLWEVRLGKETLPTRQEPDVDSVIKLIPTLDYKDAPFPELEEEPEIRNMLRGMLTQNVTQRWDIDRVISELEKVALPAMSGPHESAWLNAGCLLNPIMPPGSIVEIYGLRSQSAQELNGKSAEVLQHHPSRKTYEVRLNDGNVINVPEVRIRVIE